MRMTVPDLFAAGGRELDVIGADRDDALAGRQARDDLDPVAVADAGLDRPALKGLAAGLDVDHGAPAIVDDGALRHGHTLAGITELNMRGQAQTDKRRRARDRPVTVNRIASTAALAVQDRVLDGDRDGARNRVHAPGYLNHPGTMGGVEHHGFIPADEPRAGGLV